MESIPGYRDSEVIHAGQRVMVLRAVRESDGQLVVLKLLNDKFPNATSVARLKHEAELVGRLDLAGLISATSPRRFGDWYGMELEDVGGVSLTDALEDSALDLSDLERALSVAVDLATIVDELHTQGVVHKNINPSNVLYIPKSDGVRLIDFGMASELTSEAGNLVGGSAEATAEYMSPEQTGRMNRSVDHSSDLYSLGATLYHLFTGSAPFDDKLHPPGRLELVHAHIARKPLLPRSRRPELPEAVSNILMKLLEKDVELRYQSAFGLRLDLKQCLNELIEKGRIEPFPLRDEMVSGRMALPEKLFGRKEELGRLVADIKEVRLGAKRLVVVRGGPGIGKSRLVGELERTLAVHGGQYITGKADQFFSDQPYGPFIQSFRTLVRRLLAGSEAEIDRWRSELSIALGRNGQLIIDVVPEVELLMGPQPDVPKIGPLEARNRFQRTFLEFVRVLAHHNRLLVLFIDDLQWSDGPTLELLSALARSPDLGHVMVILAFRDNEVGPTHPLLVTLDTLADEGITIGDVELGPLEIDHVRELLQAALGGSGPKFDRLVKLVHEKTAGNPFFVNQFLTALHADGLLVFDRDQSSWRWAIEEIEKRGFTDNVVELVSSRIHRLPEQTQALIKVAACFGKEIVLEQLAELQNAPRSAVAEDLWPALEQQLLVPETSSYLLERHGITVEDKEVEQAPGSKEATTYRFLHDRVQQAADSMLDDQERCEIHLGIGRLLRARGVTEGQYLFDVVTHLNLAIPLITDVEERRALAELNLAAGKQARAAAAFEPALQIFSNGLDLLENENWSHDPGLMMNLHLDAAEAAYLNHDFERMATIGEVVLDHAELMSDRVRIREIEIQAWIAQDRRLEAIEVALPLLKELGAGIPSEPKEEDYGAGFEAAERALGDREIEALAHLSPMTDPNALAATQILSRIFSATYFAAPQLLPLVIAKLVELSATHGNSPESAFGYTLYGLHLCAFADDIERGHAFGLLSRDVLERTGADALKSRTIFIQNICITHWKEPMHATLSPLLEAYQVGLDTGDIEYTTHSLMIHNQHLLAVGHELSDLYQRMQGQQGAIATSKENAALSLFCIYQQTVANWMGLSNDPIVLTGDHHDEARMVEQHQTTGDRTSLFHIYFNKTVLSYVFHRYSEAREFAGLTRDYLDGAVGVHQVPMFHFYESLVVLTSTEIGEAELKTVKINQERVRHWADHCPENNLHRWELVEAELAAECSDLSSAIEHFERAIRLARDHGYPQEEALANERYGLFWLSRGNQDISRLYLTKARNGYELWGAQAKVDDLAPSEEQPTPKGATGTIMAPELDIESLLKAAEVLTGITSLDELMGAMMRITLENAGAGRGILFLNEKEHLVATLEVFADDRRTTRPAAIPVDEADDSDLSTTFCSALVRYAFHVKEPVVLDDTTKDERFGRNSYLMRSGVLSALCMPLSHQGRLVAVIYLENDLTTGAFTPGRLELLRLLSSQMAVSIENARAYGNLIALNNAYERFVPRQFLGYLGREEITDVRLGDQVAADMSVLFLDVRNFSSFAGDLSSAEVFAFINNLLGRIEPILDKWGGFVDKYIGDGLMALFPNSADDAVACAIEVFQDLNRYNEEMRVTGGKTIDMGIGIDSGELMLGTIGSARRMDSTVISSVVNRASRIEELNKTYSTHILIGSATKARLTDTASHCIRTLGETVARGVQVNIYEVYDADPPDSIERKNRSQKTLEEAAVARRAGDLDGAIGQLRYAVRRDPDDLPLVACLKEIEGHHKATVENERSSTSLRRSQGAWSDRLGHSTQSKKHKNL